VIYIGIFIEKNKQKNQAYSKISKIPKESWMKSRIPGGWGIWSSIRNGADRKSGTRFIWGFPPNVEKYIS
jgi:hypothetical protein